MDGNTVIAIVAALAAVGAVFYGRGEVQEGRRAANAAEEQTKIARQLRIDAAQPYVWADIRLDDATGGLLNVVVGNSGPTVAEKVRVKFDPPLPAGKSAGESVKAAQAVMTNGIESLPPGRVMQWYLGVAHEVLGNKDLPKSYKVTVTGRGPFGTLPALTYIVNVANWGQTLVRPSGNLHQVALAVKDLTKTIKERRAVKMPTIRDPFR